MKMKPIYHLRILSKSTNFEENNVHEIWDHQRTQKPTRQKGGVLPSKIARVSTTISKATIVVETSDIRVFSDDAYAKAGFEITEDLSDCDVLIGVKEVPIEALLPNKKYFFFSHTIKKQPYNRDLLKAILEKNITLI